MALFPANCSAAPLAAATKENRGAGGGGAAAAAAAAAQARVKEQERELAEQRVGAARRTRILEAQLQARCCILPPSSLVEQTYWHAMTSSHPP